MNFDDAEKTLFKHKAKIKLTAMKAAGQRLFFRDFNMSQVK